MGCTSRVWLDAQLDSHGNMRFLADSDSNVTGGFCSCLISLLDGVAPEEVLSVTTEGGVECWQRTKNLGAERAAYVNFNPLFSRRHPTNPPLDMTFIVTGTNKLNTNADLSTMLNTNGYAMALLLWN